MAKMLGLPAPGHAAPQVDVEVATKKNELPCYQFLSDTDSDPDTESESKVCVGAAPFPMFVRPKLTCSASGRTGQALHEGASAARVSGRSSVASSCDRKPTARAKPRALPTVCETAELCEGNEKTQTALQAVDAPQEGGGCVHRARPTVVILRNLPCSYNRMLLLATIDRAGFAGLYDSLHLPVDVQSGMCHGSAELNFVSVADAQRFRKKFEGFSDWLVPSYKVCSIF